MLTDIIRDPGVGGAQGSGSLTASDVFIRPRAVVHFVQRTHTNHGRSTADYSDEMSRPDVCLLMSVLVSQRRQIFYMR